jgi:Lysylphosphatidylglycerol synthase TM region
MTQWPLSPALRQRLGRWLMPLAVLAGLALLGYAIADIGLDRVLETLIALGPIMPIVLAITFFKYPLQAAAWRLALKPDVRPGWRASVAATLSGDAVGYLTWAGPLTGEPLKAYLIRDLVPVALGLTAGAAERVLYNATATIVILVAAALVLPAQWSGLLLAAGLLVSVGLLAWRGYRTRRQGAARPTRASVRTRGMIAALAHDLWRERPAALAAILAIEVAQHALLMSEAYVMLEALGAQPSRKTVVVFEGLIKSMNVVGGLVPAHLGISEGGTALLAGTLGLGASYGLGLAIMRRVRAISWGAMGLLLLWQRERQARKAIAHSTTPLESR